MALAFDVLIAGAGVVGLACARRFSMAGYETLVVESETSFGTGISSRNSEVIHAGLYYQPDSLKARLCRSGRDSLYRYCRSRGIPHQRLGKWIMATNATQGEKLEQIRRTAHINGCSEVDWLSSAEITRDEPELNAVAALVSPQTGIIDSHAYMQCLIADIEDAGGILAYRCPVASISQFADGYSVQLADEEKSRLRARIIVNACGLSAAALATTIDNMPSDQIPKASYAKGSYFGYAGRTPFRRLIYPVPEPGGLGIHLTPDLAGQARFGPDVEWVEQPDFQVDSAKRVQFARAVQSYWPACDPQKMAPAYAGVRPKLGSPEQFSDDFVVQTPQAHGLAGLINLFGIESPGLTASLALADHVYSNIKELN